LADDEGIISHAEEGIKKATTSDDAFITEASEENTFGSINPSFSGSRVRTARVW